jgi:signal transduction histidine kinase
MGPRLALAWRIALLTAAYAVVAKAGLLVATVGKSVTLVWPPTGLALAALVLGGRAMWPGVALGALVVNATTGVGLTTSAAIALGNTLEAVVGATLLLRASFRPQLDRPRDVLALVVGAAALATLSSATIGTLALWLAGLVPRAAIVETWRVWWVGDAMGALLVGPALFTTGAPADDTERRSSWEALALAATLTAAATLALTRPHATRPYLIFPPVIWAGLRFGPRGAAIATLLVSIITVGSTVLGHGTFVVSSMGENLMALHAFLVSVAMTALVLGATAAERARAIRARENFISIASHELRTPLAPIRLQVQRLLRRIRSNPEGLPIEKVGEGLEMVERQVERLSALLENVLDLTRLQRKGLALAPEKVDLGTLVDELAATMREPMAQAGCTLRVARRGSGTLTGTWDRARLGQVMTNLLANAMKYGGSGAIDVDLEGAADKVAIIVRDHGPGVPKGAEERVFRSFEHGPEDGPTKTRVQGLGLGLYISREIVEAHGGTLRLESPSDGGAAFRIELPLGVPRR